MKELVRQLLTTHQTQPPVISGFWYALLLAGMLALIGLTYRYHKSKVYVNFFKGLQLVQLMVLYSWYIACRIPLSNSLPLYHCRLAMIGLLVLPDSWSSKRYLALMGFSGAIIALAYPVLDPYDFPHLTGLSFLIGHSALLVNGLVYLLNHFGAARLKLSLIPLVTFILDLFLLGVNQLTGGNYGIMKFVPIINSTNPWLNYLVVSSVLSLLLVALEVFFRKRQALLSN